MIEHHVKLLGHKVRDKITRFEGVVSSVTFDVYGCIQAIVTPEVDDKGELREVHWFDVSRLEVISDYPVMSSPDFSYTHSAIGIASGSKGAGDRPGYPKP